FLRPDPQIARQVGEILTELLPGGPTGIVVSVRDGVVTLTGGPEPAAEEGLIPVAGRLAWDVDGGVGVGGKNGPAAGAHPGGPRAGRGPPRRARDSRPAGPYRAGQATARQPRRAGVRLPGHGPSGSRVRPR